MTASLLNLWLFWTALLPVQAHEAVQVEHDIPYRQVEGRDLSLDLYLPRDTREAVPVVVFVHGGAWVMGKKTDYVDFNRHLALEGIACAAIDYRRMPDHGFLDQVDDIKTAIRWLRGNAVQYGIDPDRIGLFGSSAGGHLAGLAGLAGDGEGLGDDPPGTSSRVQALFLLYGLSDLRHVQFPPTKLLIEKYIGATAAEDPAAYALFSPITHIDGTEPPSYIMHGTWDVLAPYEDAEALTDHLETAGVPVTLQTVPKRGHGFARINPLTRPMVYEAMRTFFRNME